MKKTRVEIFNVKKGKCQLTRQKKVKLSVEVGERNESDVGPRLD